MKLQPIYAQNIIVITRYQGQWQWYITDRDWWFLDQVKWKRAFEEYGYKSDSPQDFSERFRIAIVNIETVEDFLLNIREYKVETKELSTMLVQERFDHILELVPALYVDFDSQDFISLFPEPASYEDFVPDGWNGYYEDFLQMIPERYRYWILNGEDYFARDYEL